LGMVKIIYYADPLKSATETVECSTVADFLLSRFNTRDQLLDLRFFDKEILGHEIDQSGGDFLDINEGTVAITHNSMIPRDAITWVYVVVAVVFAATVILLKPKIPDLAGGNDQQSGTNRLGDSTNEPRVNQRIDDIFGTVNKHTPPLWQVPYRIGVNNEEVEVLLLCVGRGRYLIDQDRWFDGDTPVVNIPNACVNVYGPGTHPGSGTPELIIGELVDQPIGIYRQSNDLNPSELTPPNELETSDIIWKATGTSTTVTLTAVSLPAGVALTDRYSIGDTITVNQCFYTIPDGEVELYTSPSGGSIVPFTTYTEPLDLSNNSTILYTVTAVTGFTVTLSIPSGTPSSIVDAWDAMTDYFFPLFMAELNTTSLSGVWVKDDRVTNYPFYDNTGEPVSVTPNFYRISVGVPYDNRVGPIFIPLGATKIILNFVSSSGFYKLVENNETPINAIIKVFIYETDSEGVETGMFQETTVSYRSNDSVRSSVFKTEIIDVPYLYSKAYAERTTDRDKSDNVSNVDIIEWRDFYSFEPVSTTDFGDVTLAHVLIPSNSQSRLVKQRKQRVDVTRLITEYLGDGAFGPAESYATDQFDQILIHAMLDPHIGRLSLSNINADGFLDLRDEMVSYFGSDEMCRFGYDFDTTNITAQDTFFTICNVVMCIPYVQAGVYDAFFEKRQEVSTMQVTCRNKLPGSETRKKVYERKNDGVEITFRNNETGTVDTVYVPQDQSSLNPARETLNGCTSKLQAFRYGSRIYNKQLNQITFVKFDVDEFGRNIIPGKRLDSPDSTRFTKRAGVTDGYRVYDGEVVEVNGLEVELSEPVEFTEGEDHYIVFTKENGDNTESILCTRVNDFTVLLGSMPSEPIYDGYSRDRTKFTFTSEQLRHSVALLPQTIEFSLADDGSEVNTISLTNYSDKFYDGDLEFPL